MNINGEMCTRVYLTSFVSIKVPFHVRNGRDHSPPLHRSDFAEAENEFV